MKKIVLPFIISMLCISIAVFSQTNYYVTPKGLSTNNGSGFNSPMDLSTALNAVKEGDSVILQGGTYSIPYKDGNKNTINFSKSGKSGKNITVKAYNNSLATIDFSFPELEWVQDSYGFYVTGSYWYFKGIKITRAGYQGAYVTGGYNTFENCIFYDNRNTGLEINKGGHHTTVINCDAYYNYDPKKGGSMADGFGPKQTQGAGNKFIGCRSWENSDDGYDCYDSPEIVVFENCWAFNNGIDVWNYSADFAGNGNGFKVGGNYELANNKLTNCISFGHPNKGFDQNNNTGGLTIYNCTSYKNGINYGLGNSLASGEKHILKNNISLNGSNSNSFSNSTQANNTWSSGFSVSTSDFESLNLSLATSSRNSDGSLPETALFKLKSESNLIDAGVNVGLAYSGSAPDIGAIEYNGTVNCNATALSSYTQVNGGSWNQSNTVNVITGDKIKFGPQPSNGGAWSWHGPNGYSASTREITISNIQSSQAGTYTATFTNDCGKQSSFNISVSVTNVGDDVAITIQENETGFCSVDGSIDNNNSGYTGDGFANATNASGSGITWSVNIPSAGSYTIVWRYANGGSSDRTAQLMEDGTTIVANISMPFTGSWTSWTSSSAINTNLSAGTKLIRLQATNSTGLVNIDNISISGASVSPVSCSGLKNAFIIKDISDADTNMDIKCYPVPVDNVLNIDFSRELTETATIYLYDITGKVVMFEKVNSLRQKLDTSGLPNGLYTLRLSSKNQNVVKRVVKCSKK